MPDEAPLGGNLQDAVRVGDTVHRRAGPWTPAVHALLRYLERAGFEAPRVIGMDAEGREVLRYVPGEAHSGTLGPMPHGVTSEEKVVQAARLLRRYHDIVGDFKPAPNAKWRLVAPTAYELICHNDWSPWNAVLRDDRVAVMLDWDLAGPGSRVWDVANAAYAWTPLFAENHAGDVAEAGRRLRLFLDAYGLEDRSDVLFTMRQRLVYVGEYVAREAEGGDPGMRRLMEQNVPRKMFVDDVAFLDANWRTLEAAL